MAKVKVYRFRKYDGSIDDYFVSTRMATAKKIEALKTIEAIPGTEAEIDESLLTDGLTERDFKP
jgi:hypothetical protein